MIKHIHLPLTRKDIKNLKVGEKVLLSGIMYTARDAAHKRMLDQKVQELNFQCLLRM